MHTDEQKDFLTRIKENDAQINDMLSNDFMPAINNNQHEMTRILRFQSNVLSVTNVKLDNQLIAIIDVDQFRAVKNAKSSLNNSILVLVITSLTTMVIDIYDQPEDYSKLEKGSRDYFRGRRLESND